MEVNVYDFDKTIFDGDSTQKFYLYLLKNNPKIAFYLPKQFFYFMPFSFGIMEKTKFKEKFYSCFSSIENIEEEVEKFWDINIKGIKKWYYDNQREDDIIISASPEFLLKPICKRLNIKYLIASKVDSKTGKYDGLNCYGEEKVIRLKKEKPEVIINEFYSDSFSDEPLAMLAKKSYIVDKDNFYPWWEYKRNRAEKGNKMHK